MNKALFACVATVPLLASCGLVGSTKPSVISSSPQGVTIKFKEGEIDNATAKANDICRVQGRTAMLQRVTPQDERKRIASFDCR
ncbi:MAG: hypothetical protein EOP64_00635 [Sphingomonas sp.]|nr:MAG: hypothetical protein EOP64_00635 [Sphingomonas sp.]